MRHQLRRWKVFIFVLCLHLVIIYGEDVQNNTEGAEDQWTTLARGKKKKHYKFLLPLLMGIVLVKSFIIPLALKAMAVISGKAIMLSALSLILASIVGFKKAATGWDRVGYASLKDRTDNYFTYPQQQEYENYQDWTRQARAKQQNVDTE